MNSPLTVHDGNVALSCQTPTDWESLAGLWALRLGWPAASKVVLPQRHFGAPGQEVARPQLASRLCSQTSLCQSLV